MRNALAKAIGRRLRELREATGMSQPTLATQMGVCKQFVSCYECGRSEPSLSVIARFAGPLGVRVHAVLAPLQIEMLVQSEAEPQEAA